MQGVVVVVVVFFFSFSTIRYVPSVVEENFMTMEFDPFLHLTIYVFALILLQA